jgi:hypothetical protein
MLNETDWDELTKANFFDAGGAVGQEGPGSLFTLNIDTPLTNSGSMFLYVSFAHNNYSSCDGGTCQYPGTFFTLPYLPQTKQDHTEITWYNFHFREAFRTLNTYESTHNPETYPHILLIDLIIPADGFNISTNFDLSYNFSIQFPQTNNAPNNLDFILSSGGIISEAKPGYEFFELNLLQFQQGTKKSLEDFKVELLVKKLGDISPTSETVPNIEIYPLASEMVIWRGKDPKTCAYTATQTIPKGWTGSLTASDSGYPLIDLNLAKPGDVKTWPAKLTISCPASAVFTLPSWVYWSPVPAPTTTPTTTPIPIPTRFIFNSKSEWPVVPGSKTGKIPKKTNSFEDLVKMGILTEPQDETYQSSELTQFLSDVFLFRTQTLIGADVVGAKFPLELSTRHVHKSSNSSNVSIMVLLIIISILLVAWAFYRYKTDKVADKNKQPLNDDNGNELAMVGDDDGEYGTAQKKKNDNHYARM